MDDKTISNLKEALKLSPNNIPLKKHLAEAMLAAKRLDEAEKLFSELIQVDSSMEFKNHLANVFFLKGAYSECCVLLEEVIDEDTNEIDQLILYAKALLRENSIPRAIEIYQKAITINPDLEDEELDSNLRVVSGTAKKEEDEFLDPDLLLKPDVSFEDVGGMEDVKKEIDLKIIKALEHSEIYKAYGKKVGGGILLYGPPGCGKTFIAKATAGEVNAYFKSVSLNEILDMWMGSSEKNLHDIFETARKNTPCVLFFDEIDALGASRSDMRQSAGRHLINQFLQELDGIDSDNEGVLILGATNTPWHLDPAFRRPGRFDRIIFVPPPDKEARKAIFKLKLKEKPISNIDFDLLAKKTEKFSGADIEAVIDIAIESKLEESIKSGIPQPLLTKNLLKAAKKHKASTQEWFGTAKNFALFANDAGLYDDILKHLKIKK